MKKCTVANICSERTSSAGTRLNFETTRLKPQANEDEYVSKKPSGGGKMQEVELEIGIKWAQFS